ncbi:flagellar hook-associated protein FlgK [Chthonobacter albigriseus]|uniref:flagellar hook-associated protein FlgK n=1 Tax=Chthonobacter albigriseus TaxID=1683161 RepID=UPI0015EEF46E|nr:flagellar hook-associated protein FlgK [Chthonobacter albigriseus]
MGISTALNISLTGLKATQTGLEVASNNIANSGSVGYSRQSVTNSARYIAERTVGVATDTITREIDVYVQRQWRTSAASQEYATVMADALERLDSMFGGPTDPSSLDNVFNNFKSKLEALANAPEDRTKRLEAVSAAETISLRIRSLSDDIQQLRQEAETSIGDMVTKANTLLERIAKLDAQVVTYQAGGQTAAGALDERDKAIDELSKLMDVRVEEQKFGAVAIYTSSGTLLYDDTVATLAFDTRGTVGPGSEWTDDDATRSLGTVTISGLGANGVDLFAEGAFRTGGIAAYKALRDETLVEAQAQLDELAAAITLGVSNRVDKGTKPAGVDGFDVDLTGLREGNTISLTVGTGASAQKLTFVATKSATSPGNDYTSDPNDTVHAIDISSGAIGDIVTQINAVLGGAQTASNPSGQLLRIETGGGAQVTALTASVSSAGLQAGDPAFNLFIDAATGSNPFTGLVDGNDQKRGFAQRMMVNATVKADPAHLVNYSTTNPVSDNTRPRAILDALTATTLTFSPEIGIGSSTAPYTGTVQQFLKQIISTQGAQAENAAAVKEGQDIVTNNLQERYEKSREVDVDTELAQLIELQTAYQANARVLTAAREMLDVLMNI